MCISFSSEPSDFYPSSNLSPKTVWQGLFAFFFSFLPLPCPQSVQFLVILTINFVFKSYSGWSLQKHEFLSVSLCIVSVCISLTCCEQTLWNLSLPVLSAFHCCYQSRTAQIMFPSSSYCARVLLFLNNIDESILQYFLFCQRFLYSFSLSTTMSLLRSAQHSTVHLQVKLVHLQQELTCCRRILHIISQKKRCHWNSLNAAVSII